MTKELLVSKWKHLQIAKSLNKDNCSLQFSECTASLAFNKRHVLRYGTVVVYGL